MLEPFTCLDDGLRSDMTKQKPRYLGAGHRKITECGDAYQFRGCSETFGQACPSPKTGGSQLEMSLTGIPLVTFVTIRVRRDLAIRRLHLLHFGSEFQLYRLLAKMQAAYRFLATAHVYCTLQRCYSRHLDRNQATTILSAKRDEL